MSHLADPAQPHLVFIVGPTACGKSDFAVMIAERASRPAEILNCDSVQFFSGVEIGAAKPSRDLMNRARHHLFGHVGLGAEYTAGGFRQDALRIVEERFGAKVNSFLAVGGSGFYLLALEKGMYEVPEISPEIRAQLAVESGQPEGWAKLYAELTLRDSVAARKIQRNDRYRILRALEILRSYPDDSLTNIRKRFEDRAEKPSFRVSKLGLFRSRESLREKIEVRTRQMLAGGLIEEVESLRAKGLRDWAPLSSVGYREVQEYLDGGFDRGELEAKIVTSTMQLAKRQMTWFKRDSGVRWFDVDVSYGNALDFGSQLLDSGP